MRQYQNSHRFHYRPRGDAIRVCSASSSEASALLRWRRQAYAAVRQAACGRDGAPVSGAYVGSEPQSAQSLERNIPIASGAKEEFHATEPDGAFSLTWFNAGGICRFVNI